MATGKTELPLKEATVFRNLLVYTINLLDPQTRFNLFFIHVQKNYELRQYKKGLKLAEGILKKYPDHGGKIVEKNMYT